MQYFVVAPDGVKYGPADLETLKQWVTENRLERGTLLEETDTRQRLRAESLDGLFPAPEVVPPPAEPPLVFENTNPPPEISYPRDNSDAGSRELASAWVWTIFGIFIPVVLPSVGLSFANKAIAKGNEDAHSARIFAITILVAQLVILLAAGAIVGIVALALSSSG